MVVACTVGKLQYHTRALVVFGQWPLQANSSNKNCFVQLSLLLKFWSIVMVSSVAWMEWSATSYFLCEAADYEYCPRVPSAGWGWKEKRREMEAGWAILMWMTTHWWFLLTIAWVRKWSVFITCHSCLVVTYHLSISYLTHIQTEQLFTLIYLMWTHYSNTCTSICNLHTSARLQLF